MLSPSLAFIPYFGSPLGPVTTTSPIVKLTARRPRFVHFTHRCRIATRTHEFPSSNGTTTMMASDNVDFYKVLELNEDADQQAIKRAYRRAALKNHPDVSDAPDAREQFLKIQEAYSVLSDDNRRTSYDRMRRSGQTSASPFGDSFGGFGTDPSTAEFARRWREGNPMPEDINDNIGNIFSDLFSGVADAVSGTAARSGVVEDFVDFLERRVDNGSSTPSSSSSSASSPSSTQGDDSLDDVLRSSDEDILRAEIDDANFVIDQLRQRRTKAQSQEDDLRDRVRQWQDRADRADRLRDYDTRDAARDRADDLTAESRRFAKRVDETNIHIRKQDARLRRIEGRLEEVQAAPPRASSDTKSSMKSDISQERRQTQSTAVNQEEAIDQELERMKRELGL